MTAIEKRKFLEFINRFIIYDFLSDTDVYKILDICDAAVDRSIKKAMNRLMTIRKSEADESD